MTAPGTGRTENRTVVSWDKDDCTIAGLVKFDLLGLGMLTALHELGEEDPAVDAMLQPADSVGVFQVESRARWPPSPSSSPARSTTWSSRSR
jgi:error-prone DNA polymerase